ncbi:MAG: S66 peptidase family protein, partial [Gemmatimonadaceae bacterium]
MPIQSLLPVQSLVPGARVALIAPSGPLHGEADIQRGCETVQSFGWEPVLGEYLLARYSYFAATDEQRLADFNRMLRDDSVDAIWCLRGGYGAMRILSGLDWEALRRRPRAVMGYSDITAFHAAIGRICGIVSYHAPVARAELTPFSLDSFGRALVTYTDPCGYAPAARV